MRNTEHVRAPALATAAARLGARAVDGSIVLAVLSAGALIPGGSESATATTVTFVLVTIAVTIYETCWLRLWARTPGKALLGLSVVTTDRQPVTLLRAAARASIVWTILILGLFVGGILGSAILIVALAATAGPIITRHDRRGLDDLMAGTVVVRGR